MYNKKELRKHFAYLREKCDTRNQSHIVENLLSCDEYINADTVYSYISFRTEIDTTPIISDSFIKGKTVCVPKCEPKDHTMKFIEINSFGDLGSGAYGIKEPLSDTASEKKPDLIIIPALSCDLKGIRLGYGGGYYDRFLAGYIDVPKLVLMYDSLISDSLPAESTDIPIDIIITESRIIKI